MAHPMAHENFAIICGGGLQPPPEAKLQAWSLYIF
jgi:hypothetical protein